MKNWNIHSTWIIGILLSLLIGSLSVDWVGIRDLPGIISFAVGLSSLILAVIAIFQTLSSTGSVEASLAAVREATAGSASITSELAESAAKIQKAATDAQNASSMALAATSEFSTIASTLMANTEAGNSAIQELRQDLRSKGSSSLTSNEEGEGENTHEIKSIVMGGAAALYALVKSLETGKSFTLEEIFPEDKNISFEDGYISALSDFSIVELVSMSNNRFRARKISMDIEKIKDHVLNTEFGDEQINEDHEQRIKSVDKFFDASK